MRRVHTLSRRPDSKVAAGVGSRLWQGMGRLLRKAGRRVCGGHLGGMLGSEAGRGGVRDSRAPASISSGLRLRRLAWSQQGRTRGPALAARDPGSGRRRRRSQGRGAGSHCSQAKHHHDQPAAQPLPTGQALAARHSGAGELRRPNRSMVGAWTGLDNRAVRTASSSDRHDHLRRISSLSWSTNSRSIPGAGTAGGSGRKKGRTVAAKRSGQATTESPSYLRTVEVADRPSPLPGGQDPRARQPAPCRGNGLSRLVPAAQDGRCRVGAAPRNPAGPPAPRWS